MTLVAGDGMERQWDAYTQLEVVRFRLFASLLLERAMTFARWADAMYRAIFI